MAEQILKTRIKLLVRTYEEWTGSHKNDILLKGEVGFCIIESKTQGAQTAPTMLFKVGTYDGTNESTKKTFEQLKWCSALAADVYDWAKKSEEEFLAYLDEKVKAVELTNYYTKTKVDELLTANSTADKAHADTVAGTAKTEAIAAAAADATTKANKAKDDAIVHANGLNSAMDSRVKAIEDDHLVAEDKTELEGKITELSQTHTKDKAALDAIDQDFETRIADLEGHFGTGTGTVEAQIAAAVAAEAELRTAADAAIQKELDDYQSSNDTEVAAVRTIAEAARTEDEVNAQIQAKITALDLSNTYEPKGAEQNAKNYVDQKFTDANLAQYTTEEEVNKIVDKVITDAVDGDTLTSLTDLVKYLSEHGGEYAELAATVGGHATKISALEAIPAHGITATQISNWDNEVGAKALAETKLDATTFASYESAHANDYTNGQIDTAIATAKSGAEATAASALATARTQISTEIATAKSGAEATAASALATARTEITTEIGTAISAEVSRADGKYEEKGVAATLVSGLEIGQVKANKEAIAAINNASTGILKQAKDYADGLAGNYATAEQGGKADSALQAIEVGTGLKVSAKADNKQMISIDEDVIFILDCNY